jgi:hypothetical protein
VPELKELLAGPGLDRGVLGALCRTLLRLLLLLLLLEGALAIVAYAAHDGLFV